VGNDDIRKLTMPKWGFSMTHGRVVEWLAAEGTQISCGDEVLEVETEKSVGVVESPVGGTLRRHVARSGQEIPVGGLLAVVGDASVSDDEIDRFVEAFVPEETSDESESSEAAPEFAEVGGRTLRYLKQGDGSPSALLVHGFAGNLNNWLFNQTVLASDRAVYALDLPGHGRSSKDVGDGSLETLANMLCEWLDTVGLPRVHLVGHSMGGAIALAMALEHPDRVLSCTLIASAALGSEIDADYLDGVVKADRRKQLKPYLERLFADPSLATRQLVDDVLKFKRVDGVREALTTLVGSFVADGKQARVYRDRLDEISVPILVIWGKNDRVLPPSHAEALPERCEVEVLSDCGHMVQMEASGEVNRLIARFLQKIN
jgi:pyruvate dehydrogenase E2 component (dihydrolipoamide acetyltransferase)